MSILPFARGCRVGVWFGFVGAALFPAVGTCVVLAFGAMPGRCCFLRVTHMAYAMTRVALCCFVAVSAIAPCAKSLRQ